MKIVKLFSLLPIISAPLAALTFTNVSERDTNVIIEIDENKDYKSTLNYIRNNVTNNFSIGDRYSELFNGYTLSINNKDLDKITSLPFIKDYDIDNIHYLNPNDTKSVLGNSVTVNDNLSAISMNKPTDSNEGAGVSIAILDSSFYLEHECFSALNKSTTTKYSKEDIENIKSNEGFHGNGLTYFNNKVPYYFDYGGDIKEDGTKVETDNDVFTALSDHGQHVASLAGGNGSYKGIAPNAQLLLMKVFTSDNKTKEIFCYDSKVLTALEDCVKLDVDIINMSFGSDLDDFRSDSLVNKKINELKEKGTFVCLAAGNSGKDLYQSSSSIYRYWDPSLVETGIMSEYSNNDSFIAVGSSTASYYYYETAFVIGDNMFPYTDQVTNYILSTGEYVHYDVERKMSDLTYPLTYQRVPGNGEESDYDGISVTNKIAVINRGVTTFTDKVKIAYSHGAVGVIVVDNEMSEDSFTYRMDFNGYQPPIPVSLVLYSAKNIFSDSGLVSLTSNVIAPNKTLMSDFSSDGATVDLDIKPDISTPGDLIKGAIYQRSLIGYSKTAYGYYSGTSMASPNLAGAIAVILSSKLGDESFKSSLVSRLTSNATPINKEGVHLSPRKQGSGIVNIANTLSNQVYAKGIDSLDNTEIDKARILLRNNEDIKNGKLKLSFNLYSESNVDINYEAKVYIYRSDTFKDNNNTYMLTSDKLIDTFSKNITAKSNSKTSITLDEYELSNDVKNEINSLFPNGTYIEGYIELHQLDTLGSPNINIPFLGFYGDYNSVSPVEPFTFEQKDNMLYPSDYVNDYLSRKLGSSYKGDYSSMVVIGKYDESCDFTSIFENKMSMLNLNGFRLATPTYNEAKGQYVFSVNNKGTDSSLIFQQFVTRSVKDNTFTITNLDTNKVVCNDNMFDALTNQTSLYKSMITSELSKNNHYAHRAYTIIDMKNQETGERYAPGNYQIDITYHLVSGGTYSLSYGLIISEGNGSDGMSPAIVILIIVGCVAALTCIVMLGLYLTSKKKQTLE